MYQKFILKKATFTFLLICFLASIIFSEFAMAKSKQKIKIKSKSRAETEVIEVIDAVKTPLALVIIDKKNETSEAAENIENVENAESVDNIEVDESEEIKPIISDPFETWNRAIFAFNTKADNYVVKPLAIGYQKIIPEPIRNCINGVFGTVEDVFTLLNQTLQLNAEGVSQSLCRLMVNTTFGLGGCFDIASSLGCLKGNEDLGQTLGFWGVKTGPFVMLPLLGPSNVRDTGGFIMTTIANPTFTFKPTSVRNSLQGLNVINTRANLLETTNLVDDVAIDAYSFIRDSFSQKRRNDVYNGDVPEEK